MKRKELPEKMFYTITEVAQHFGVSEPTLRFWEKEFDIIAPKRSDNKRQIRSYTAKDIHNIGLIYHLLKEQGMTLSGAKERLRKKPAETEARYEVISRLRTIRAELVDICRELSAGAKSAAEPPAAEEPSSEITPDAGG